MPPASALAIPVQPQPALERARAGDADGFADLVREHQRMVFSLALRIVRDPAMAEELSQDAFLQLHQHVARLESAAHVAHWLRRVVVNRAIDVARRERGKRRVPVDEAELSVPHADTDLFLYRALRTQLAALPVRARAVIVLRYQEDLDPKEIAATLGIPLNTVKSHLRRSLAVLRARVARLTGEPDDAGT